MFNQAFKFILLATTYVSTALAHETVEFTTHKILMAGSLEPSEHDYFLQVAKAISENPETRNVVYLLNFATKGKEAQTIDKINDRLYTIQVP
jgi:spore coat polysaccharide biosynthesis protein SpsF (cytidylyltransferase family)